MKHAREDYNRIQDPEGKIGADEPVFLLRAKDELAPGILMNYAQELLVRGGQGSVRMVNMVREHARLMVDWQQKNGSHLPDLPPEEVTVEKSDRQLLEEAHSILRSLYSVTARSGSSANWSGLQTQIEKALAEQHQYFINNPTPAEPAK